MVSIDTDRNGVYIKIKITAVFFWLLWHFQSCENMVVCSHLQDWGYQLDHVYHCIYHHPCVEELRLRSIHYWLCHSPTFFCTSLVKNEHGCTTWRSNSKQKSSFVIKIKIYIDTTTTQSQQIEMFTHFLISVFCGQIVSVYTQKVPTIACFCSVVSLYYEKVWLILWCLLGVKCKNTGVQLHSCKYRFLSSVHRNSIHCKTCNKIGCSHLLHQ